ncbi:zinc transporter 2 [Nematostella vectensis]|uniref:zinc transporter 2 n=1 Tax=Nematostella vectensis TaxID=45351 RepID=UPI0020777699|nr:zinc transporter 2 [Nematostella vectensis]
MKKSSSNPTRRLRIASFLCLFFMIAEFVGGYFSNSLAIMTDAAHMLSDFAGFMISLFAIWVATRPATKTLSYGWYRAEVMGAVLSVLVIWVLTGVLVYMALQRLIMKEYEVDAKVMLITASGGLLINVIMGAILYQKGHGHSHGGMSGHGHSHTTKGQSHSHTSPGKSPSSVVTIEEEENVNVRAAFIHVIGDFLQSLGVFVAALIIWFKPEWAIADPICTFIFSIIVLFTTLAILKDALIVLMEGMPKGLSFNDLKTSLTAIPGVEAVHDLHVWSLTVGTDALSVHLVVDNSANTQDILEAASQVCSKSFDIHHSTIQIETDNGSRKESCKKCDDPQD